MPVEEWLRDTTALGGMAVYGVVALLFLLEGRIDVFVALAVAVVLCYAVVSGIRLVFFRRRPDRQKYAGWLGRIDASAFPSLHSARAGILAFVLWQVFPGVLFRAVFVACALAVVVTRVLLKRHYVSDVIGGIVLGLVIGWLSWVLAPVVLGAVGLA